MEARSRLLWILTAANLVVAALLVLVIYAMIYALAAFAAYVPGWPLFVLLPVGVVLSIVGLKLTSGIESSPQRRVAILTDVCALTLNVMIVIGLAALHFGGTEERFLIPEGYKGDVYVLHNAPDGQPENKTGWSITYDIPADGILRARGPVVRGLTRQRYYYRRENGTLERITYRPTTIHRTPENLADDREIGVFFHGTTTFRVFGGTSTGCPVELESFYVGSKADLLTRHKGTNIAGYLRDHPVGCAGEPK